LQDSCHPGFGCNFGKKGSIYIDKIIPTIADQ